MKRLKFALKKEDVLFETHQIKKNLFLFTAFINHDLAGSIEFTVADKENEYEVYINNLKVIMSSRNNGLITYLLEEFIEKIKKETQKPIVIDGTIVNKSLGGWLDQNRQDLENKYGVKFVAEFNEIASTDYYQNLLFTPRRGMECEVKTLSDVLIMFMYYSKDILDKLPNKRFLKNYLSLREWNVLDTFDRQIEDGISLFVEENSLSVDEDYTYNLVEYITYFNPKYTCEFVEENDKIGLLFTFQLLEEFQIKG